MSTRLTFGAMLNTVQSAATTITSTLDATARGVGMLTSYVEHAADQQKLRHIVDKESFVEELIRNKAYEDSQSAMRASKYCGQSAEHKATFEKAYSRYSTLLRPEDQAVPATS